MNQQVNKRRGWLLIGDRRFWMLLAATILLGALSVGCAAALMFTSGELISRSALRPENVLMVYVPIVLVRTFGLGKAALQYVQRLAGHHVALTALSAMRAKLYRLLERQAVNLRNRYRLGDLFGLLIDDIEQLQNLYLRVVFPALSGLIVYGGVVVLLATQSFGMVTVWLLAYGGFWLFVTPLIALCQVDRMKQRHQPYRAWLYRHLVDTMFGMTDWVLSGRSPQGMEQFRLRQVEAATREKALRRMEWNRQWLSRCATAGALFLMVYWVSGQLEAGMENIWIAAFVLAVFPLMETFASVNDAIVRLPDYHTSLKRLRQVEEGEPSTEEASNQEKTASPSDFHVPVSAPVDIQVEHVYFRYRPQADWILKDISLSLPHGKKVAVLGRSGAGKTTLLQVLSGQRHVEKGGITLNGVPLQANRKPFTSILNQKPYLFHTTIANNIRMGCKDASDEEIHQVVERVGLAELIASLPDGYDTMMEEAGSRFSGGERQRIALARILLQSPPLFCWMSRQRDWTVCVNGI